jgi:hypothetical protein
MFGRLMNQFYSQPTSKEHYEDTLNGGEQADSSINTTNRPDVFTSYMLVKADENPHLTDDLDLDSYLKGEKDAFFKELYSVAPSVSFFDPKDRNKKWAGRPYTVFTDLAQLVREKSDRLHLGASDKYSYVLCFNLSSKEVYSHIANGKFHEAIVKAINFRDINKWYYTESCKTPFQGEVVDVAERMNAASQKTIS